MSEFLNELFRYFDQQIIFTDKMTIVQALIVLCTSHTFSLPLVTSNVSVVKLCQYFISFSHFQEFIIQFFNYSFQIVECSLSMHPSWLIMDALVFSLISTILNSGMISRWNLFIATFSLRVLISWMFFCKQPIGRIWWCSFLLWISWLHPSTHLSIIQNKPGQYTKQRCRPHTLEAANIWIQGCLGADNIEHEDTTHEIIIYERARCNFYVHERRRFAHESSSIVGTELGKGMDHESIR